MSVCQHIGLSESSALHCNVLYHIIYIVLAILLVPSRYKHYILGTWIQSYSPLERSKPFLKFEYMHGSALTRNAKSARLQDYRTMEGLVEAKVLFSQHTIIVTGMDLAHGRLTPDFTFVCFWWRHELHQL